MSEVGRERKGEDGSLGKGGSGKQAAVPPSKLAVLEGRRKALSAAGLLQAHLDQHLTKADSLVDLATQAKNLLDCSSEVKDALQSVSTQKEQKNKAPGAPTKESAADQAFMKDLVDENKELHAFVNEVKTTMQVVVDHRRKQVDDLLEKHHELQRHAQTAEAAADEKVLTLEKEVVRLQAKLEEMQKVMCAAVEADKDAPYDALAEEIVRVETENKQLRELLQICDTTLKLDRPASPSSGSGASNSSQADTQSAQAAPASS